MSSRRAVRPAPGLRRAPGRRATGPRGALHAVVALAMTCGGCTLPGTPQPTTSTASPTPSTTPTAGAAVASAPVVAFIGDSYASGYLGGGVGPAAFPEVLGRILGLRVVNASEAGSGYIHRGGGGSVYGDRVARVLAADPAIVVVEGSSNDRGAPSPQLRAAARSLLCRLRTGAPTAMLVVVGPIHPVAAQDPLLTRLRRDLREVATSVGVDVFIDPVEAGWLTDRPLRHLLADGIHPSDAGHQELARLLKTDLKRPTATRPPTDRSYCGSGASAMSEGR